MHSLLPIVRPMTPSVISSAYLPNALEAASKVLQTLGSVVRLDGLTLDQYGRVSALEVRAAGRHRPCHVAPREQGGSQKGQKY